MTNIATHVYAIDPTHTSIGFSIRHLMISKVRGTFGSVTGTVELGATGLIPASVKAEIDVASIQTRDENRDAHLKSPDFFEVETYPKMSFESTSIEALDDTRFNLTGDLEIHGTKQPVTFEAEVAGKGNNPFGAGERIAYEAKTKIKRSDFGLKWNTPLDTGGVALSDEVEITLDVQAVG